MLAVVGTVPDLNFPLTHGAARLVDGSLIIDGRDIAVNRGTPALIASALKAAEWLGNPQVYAFLAGDIGRGEGSRRIYEFLTRNIAQFDFDVLTFHYLQPDVDWHNKVLFAVQAMKRKPILIADAGFMYAAKMSGQAPAYDFFTPDAGELAFLADELAPHPFYTRGFILHQHDRSPDLIRRAYQHGNSAAGLLVKGAADYIVKQGQVIAKVDQPSFDAMEAIGGTGDSLTGILTALCGAGMNPFQAAILAARTNRWMGHFTDPTPAMQIAELIDQIPHALSVASNGAHDRIPDATQAFVPRAPLTNSDRHPGAGRDPDG
jgi:ADP-dependent NAD(P)H-hydrate dehydratase / NAD(P)H-hydrate epimerase